jgi:hypothetical protein
VQDVTLIMQAGPDDVGADGAPVGDRLRVLGLFGLPEGGKSLNLRRERDSLVTLIHGIAATGKAADVRVLQYVRAPSSRERIVMVAVETRAWPR